MFEQTGLSVSIPDNTSAVVTRGFFVPYSRALRAEHVTVSVSIQHSRRGDLAITLISPHGTESRLAERHFDFNKDYRDWKFMSVFHWGESTAGQWQVKIQDRRTQKSGVLESIRLELFGTSLLGGSEKVQRFIECAYKHKARAMKPLGASGGGHLLVVCDIFNRKKLINAMENQGGTVIPLHFSQGGMVCWRTSYIQSKVLNSN